MGDKIMPDFKNDQQQSAKWAWDLLNRSDWCILDTETTGLDNDSQICQISVIDAQGITLLDTLVKPTVPIPPDAMAIHHISDEMVKDAPSFENILIPLLKAVGKRDLIIYNCEYDIRLIRQSAKIHGIPLAFPTSDRRGCRVWIGGGGVYCAMLQFSQWCGEWSSYHGNYRWQRLPGGDHSALGDCLATLEIIKQMASSWEGEPNTFIPSVPESAKMTVFHATTEESQSGPEYDDIPF